MIRVLEVVKSYAKGAARVDVLTGVTFTVAPGEFVAIMGASGSGKSTLLNLLGFLDRPDAGTYLFEGVDWSDKDDDARSVLRNRKIGFVFQQFHLLDRATALRNVMLPLLYAEGEATDDVARAEGALAAVGLSHRGDHFPGELSGGEQQRAAIARALINAPSLILADEPTGNLDARAGSEILELFAGLRDAGRAIVLVTHDLAAAQRADRILRLDGGRILS